MKILVPEQCWCRSGRTSSDEAARTRRPAPAARQLSAHCTLRRTMQPARARVRGLLTTGKWRRHPRGRMASRRLISPPPIRRLQANAGSRGAKIKNLRHCKRGGSGKCPSIAPCAWKSVDDSRRLSQGWRLGTAALSLVAWASTRNSRNCRLYEIHKHFFVVSLRTRVSIVHRTILDVVRLR